MRIKFISDFHTEWWGYSNKVKFERLLEKYLPSQEDDKDTILCCAGDMGVWNNYASSTKPILKLLSDRFHHVIVVSGNHEYYNSVGLFGNDKKFLENKALPKNVSYLENDFVILGDVIFIGATLWTNFGYNPVASYAAEKGMNDFVCIKTGIRVYDGPYIDSRTKRLTAEETVRKHEESVEFIKQTLKLYPYKRSVVVTHHAPTWQSVTDQYKTDVISNAFASELSKMILEYEPDIWHHGHTHHHFDYNVGRTRILCNCLGYHPQQLQKDFDPNFVVTL